MLDMSVEDASTKFKNTVMMIDGCAKYVKNIRSIEEFDVLDIRSGMDEMCRVNEKNLKTPERIGFLQYDHLVVYAKRISARMWKAGLSTENVQFEFIGCPKGGGSEARALSAVRKLFHASVALALEGEYPSLKIARRKAKQSEGTYAFDKQFAVDCHDSVYYKTHKVGSVNRVGRIIFNENAMSLEALLGEQNA